MSIFEDLWLCRNDLQKMLAKEILQKSILIFVKFFLDILYLPAGLQTKYQLKKLLHDYLVTHVKFWWELEREKWPF